jgi:hypothetical protein
MRSKRTPREQYALDDNTGCIAAYSANRVSEGVRGEIKITDDYDHIKPTEATSNYDITSVGRDKSITANSLCCPTKKGIKNEVGHRTKGDKRAMCDITNSNISDGSRQEARKNSTFANSDNCSTNIGVKNGATRNMTSAESRTSL